MGRFSGLIFHGKENGSRPRCRREKGARRPWATERWKQRERSGEQGQLQDRTSLQAEEHPPVSAEYSVSERTGVVVIVAIEKDK